jgi:hypothetical protein
MIEIPKALIEQIKEGNVVLFLGAGALKGAIHRDGKDAPSGPQLGKLIADKFLDDDYSNSSLSVISEIAMSDTGLLTVQQFIAEYFDGFEPNLHHQKIPQFRWKAIVTTNYDLVIEKSYSQCEKPKQTLVKFIKDERINDKIKTINDLPYIKLHGCITVINDGKLPLILTIDQYVTHKKNRLRLFERVNDLAKQHTFIFAGHSLEDSDIREVLLNLGDDLTARMRSYIIAPDVKPAMERFWGTKKITTLNCKFSEFIEELTGKIDMNSIPDGISMNINQNIDHPIIKKLFESSNKPSEILINFLSNNVIYPHANLIVQESVSPRDFYKGYMNGLSPIANELDVRRELESGILSEIFIDLTKDDSATKLFLILGHAGSGKTVFLNRLAWEATNSLGKNCYILKKDVLIDADAILELYTFLKERIYLVVDNANNNEIELVNLIERAQKESIPLTLITGERTNIWNVECNRVKNYLTHSYYLKYLTRKEIEDLLDLLEMHDCLNHLKGKSRVLQIKEFEERAGRELLVALYEATQGKTFQEIVFDEYQSIPVEKAKALYLTVCLLHSLGSYTRAGLLARVHGINFNEFKDKFFEPLEFLVFERRDYYINDYVYESRHPLISEFVVESVLSSEQMRFDEYILLLSSLDIDYDSDRNAFLYLTNAKKLLRFFRNPDKIREIYNTARERSYEDAKLFQQEAIFEMDCNGGSIDKAETLLYKADELTNHRDNLIRHSLAELLYTKATNATSLIEKKRLLIEVDKICQGLIRKRNFSAHPFHTAIKSKLMLLNEYVENSDDYAFDKLIKETEKLISFAVQQFPDEPHIIESESNFNELINNQPKAIRLLEKAFEINKNSPYLSRRLASVYESQNEIDKAISTINATLNTNAGEKDLNYKLALLLAKKHENGEILNIKHYLRRSFSPKDNRYHAQFWYARILYLNNELPESQSFFEELSKANLDPKIKAGIRGVIKKNALEMKVFKGEIFNLHTNFGFVKRDGLGDTIYFYMYNKFILENEGEYSDDSIFSILRRGSRVKFNIGFNYKGTIALNISLE